MSLARPLVWIGTSWLTALLLCNAALGAPAAKINRKSLSSPFARPTPTPTAKLFVTNPCNNSVTAYSMGPDGTYSPLTSGTGLGLPAGLAVDSSGRIYAANSACNTVTVYAPHSNGAAKPIATISGPDTGLFLPHAIALDSAGNIYVANCALCAAVENLLANDSITIYPPGSDGDASPIATIVGPDTALDAPAALALDASGNIYVANWANRSISTYPGLSTLTAFGSAGGDISPNTLISGPSTGLQFPSGIAVDGGGNIYAVTQSNNSGAVAIFPPQANGDVQPIATISGPSLDGASGIALDSKARAYVTNYSSLDGRFDSLTIFAPHSQGNAVPIVTIGGSGTRLSAPSGIAVGHDGTIYVANGTSLGYLAYYPTTPAQNTITVYPTIGPYLPGSLLNEAPRAVIGDRNLGLLAPTGIALDPHGKVYVVNSGGNGSVTSYMSSGVGTASPIATLGENAFPFPDGLGYGPVNVATDSKGQIYVTAFESDILIFSPESSPFAPPTAFIASPYINSPAAVALDSTGDIYVANDGYGDGGLISIFSPGSKGQFVQPLAVINGPDAGLANPQGIAVDSQDNIYVTNCGNCVGGTQVNNITVYAAGSSGDAKPIAVIDGPDTGLVGPEDIAIDKDGTIYVANGGDTSNRYPHDGENSVLVFAPHSNGDAKPIATISAGLELPFGIALAP